MLANLCQFDNINLCKRVTSNPFHYFKLYHFGRLILNNNISHMTYVFAIHGYTKSREFPEKIKNKRKKQLKITKCSHAIKFQLLANNNGKKIRRKMGKSRKIHCYAYDYMKNYISDKKNLGGGGGCGEGVGIQKGRSFVQILAVIRIQSPFNPNTLNGQWL